MLQAEHAIQDYHILFNIHKSDADAPFVCMNHLNC